MGCEIEFLAVGDASRAGDAIVIRYGEEHNYKLMVVDGGTVDTGEKLVTHLKAQFGTSAVLEHLVLSHADSDHASGLREVLKEIPVKNFWLHIPWLLSDEAISLFQYKLWTKESLAAAIKKEYDILVELVDLATTAGTPIMYPFQGSQIGPFTVLSPRRATYVHLLPQFDKTPEPDQSLLESLHIWIAKGNAASGLAGLFKSMVEKVQQWLTENWYLERLKDGGITSASNESSVVLYADIPGVGRFLLTADAGIQALYWAIGHAKSCGYVLRDFSFVQIPHHGSRRNVGPSVLNELIGPIQPEGTQKFTAFVSAPADDTKHPRKIVLNAFIRRGGRVLATQGQNKVHWGGFSPRPGYLTVVPLGLSTTVEDYD